MWAFADLEEKSSNCKLLFRFCVLCASLQKFCLVLFLQQNVLFSWILSELSKIQIPEPICLPFLSVFPQPCFLFLSPIFVPFLPVPFTTVPFNPFPYLAECVTVHFWTLPVNIGVSAWRLTAPQFCCILALLQSLCLQSLFTCCAHTLPHSKPNFMLLTNHVSFWFCSLFNVNSPFLGHFL